MMEDNFKPLVTVVMPVYNGSNYMREAIDSVLEQDYKNLEIILVNDGSRDNTEEIAKSYGNKIKYLSKENGGVATALNMAIENANGEYISWLSHDDVYLPDKISRQIQYLANLENRKNVIVFSDMISLDSTTGKMSERILADKFDMTPTKINNLKMLYSSLINGCSLLIPKEAFENCGYFNPELKTTQDYDRWFNFLENGYSFHYVPGATVITRVHPQRDSITKADICAREGAELKKITNKTFLKEIKKCNHGEMKIFKTGGFVDRSPSGILRKNIIKAFCIFVPIKSWRKKIRSRI